MKISKTFRSWDIVGIEIQADKQKRIMIENYFQSVCPATTLQEPPKCQEWHLNFRMKVKLWEYLGVESQALFFLVLFTKLDMEKKVIFDDSVFLVSVSFKVP